MKGFFDFILDILMLKKQDKSYVGLSRMKAQEVEVATVTRISAKKRKDVKISDLMRRAS